MITATRAQARFPRDINGITRADKRFGRYKSEKHEPVRDIEVKGDEKQRLEQTREMLRSMTTDQVIQIIEWHKNLTVFEALILAKQEGKIIVPNSIHDRILTETIDKQYLQDHYPVWAGTFVIYEAPDKPFGNEVVFTWEYNEIQYTITFNVPKKYQGKKNCALVIEHPDFDLQDLGNNNYELKVADENNIHLIKRFPKETGRCLTDDKYKIPVRKFFFGRKISESNEDARYLFRSDNDAYCGSVGRDVIFSINSGRHGVEASVDWSEVSGVAMVPLATVAKQSDKHDG